MTSRNRAINITADAHRQLFAMIGAMVIAAFLMGVAMVKAEEHYRVDDLKNQEVHATW